MADTQAAPSVESAAPVSTPAQIGGTEPSVSEMMGSDFDDSAQPISDDVTDQSADTQTEDTSQSGKPERSAAPPVNPKKEEILQALAKETGLDLNDPTQRSTLEKIFNSPQLAEHFKSQGTEQEPSDGLTEFERSLQEETQNAASPAKPAAQVNGKTEPQIPGAPQPIRLGDRGDKWESPIDALNDEVDLWNKLGDAAEAKDPVAIKAAQEGIRDVRNAVFARQYMSMVRPDIQQMIQQAIKASGIESIAPHVKASMDEKQNTENMNFAVSEILSVPGNDDLKGMYEVTPDAPEIEFRGTSYPATPFNQIVSEFPEILDIRVSNADPNKAAIATRIAQNKAVGRIFRQQQKTATSIPADRAAALVKAGADSAKKGITDRTRQAVNSGGTGKATRNGSSSFVQELINSGKEMGVNDLFS